MKKNCKDKEKFKTAEASSKASLRTKGVIDKFLNILNINEFNKYNKEWSENAKQRFQIEGKLFYIENDKAIPNKIAFKKIDKGNGISYSINNEETTSSKASNKTLGVIKDFIKRIGVDYNQLSKITVGGKTVDAQGIARIMEKVIEVV